MIPFIQKEVEACLAVGKDAKYLAATFTKGYIEKCSLNNISPDEYVLKDIDNSCNETVRFWENLAKKIQERIENE